MNTDKIINEWKKKNFKPVYLFEGEESYFIDLLTDYAETKILTESEASFNLTVFYGKDANWVDIINASRRYPMFADRQVVILKEAQQMRDLDKLSQYVDKPLSSTVFIISHKEKKLDGRTALARMIKDKGEIVSTKKLYENQLPDWTNELVQSKGYTIAPKALALLIDHIGNDLSRIENEITKMLVNLGNRRAISEDDIENYVGISKEYNSFELQAALAKKNLSKAIQIISYFEANPKAAPIQLILPTLYNLFSKTYMIFGQDSRDDKQVAVNIGVNAFFVKDYLLTAKNYGFNGTENALLLLHHYNLRSIGIHDAGTNDASLLKEMVVKMMN
ncbi:MAG: DNA polymerase III subunit delta [Chitinophagaceae bacterium]|nr:MAG: DNA polymerase III subunit delta [Chitinophagaceae bacterium]